MPIHKNSIETQEIELNIYLSSIPYSEQGQGNSWEEKSLNLKKKPLRV